MGRQEIYTGDLKIAQHDDLVGDLAGRKPDIVTGERITMNNTSNEYLDELAFNEEPVTILIQPSTEKNAAAHVPVWNNGRGAEVLLNGQWVPCGHLPVNCVITTKRKYVEILLRAKLDTVNTDVIEEAGKDPINKVKRFTTAAHSFSIIKDDNPLSQAWLTEVRRRNM